MDRLKQKSSWAVILVFAAIAITRLVLVSKGHFHLQDELRYRYTFAFIRELVSGNFREAMAQLFQFNLYARPLLVIFNLPTALLQVILLLITGIKTETPVSLTIPSVVQVVASLGNSWLVYKLGKRYCQSELLALAGVIVYSFLTNTNLYLRHIGPYDSVLLLYLLLLYWILNQYRTSHWVIMSTIVGVSVTSLYLVYPAYYLFGVVLAFLAGVLPKGHRWQRGLILVGWGVGILGVVEWVSRSLGLSYWRDAAFAAGRVVVGDKWETPIFLWKYLWQVEGWMGKLLAIGLVVAIGIWLARWKQYKREWNLLMVAMLGVYLIHGLSGPLLGKVYYGRLIHMFVWFAVLATLMGLKPLLEKNWLKYGITAGMIGVSLVSFVNWYPQFLGLNYPTDVLYGLCQNDCATYVSFVNENYPPDDPGNRVAPEPKWLAVNFGKFFIPVTETTYSYDILGGKLVYQQPHPLNFPAYQFEGHSIEERQRLQQRNYQMKLYQLK